MKKFEYKCAEININEARKDKVTAEYSDNYITEVILNAYGDDGWELITILNRDNFNNITTILLKKEII